MHAMVIKHTLLPQRMICLGLKILPELKYPSPWQTWSYGVTKSRRIFSTNNPRLSNPETSPELTSSRVGFREDTEEGVAIDQVSVSVCFFDLNDKLGTRPFV